MRWTQQQLDAHEARLRGQKQPPPDQAVEDESELHEQIRRACADRGWLPLHGSMAHRTFRTKGEWDFVILAEYPRLFLVECKDRTGKMSHDQLGLHAWAKRLGWKPTVCRSIAEFWTYVATY